MNLVMILIYSLLLFAIIYLSVNLAIKPLLIKQEESLSLNKNLELVKLRDIDVLSNDELEEVIKLYQDIKSKKKIMKNMKNFLKFLMS